MQISWESKVSFDMWKDEKKMVRIQKWTQARILFNFWQTMRDGNFYVPIKSFELICN